MSHFLSTSVSVSAGAVAFAVVLAFSGASSALTGCANAKGNFFPLDGSADGATTAKDGGTEGGSGSSPCVAACATFAERSTTCEDTAACETGCKAGRKEANSASCQSEFDDLVTCAAGDGTGGKKPGIKCDSAGKLTVSTGCTAEKSALESCLGTTPTKKDGGSSSCTLKEPVDSQPACNSCAEQNCCADWNACTDDTDCAAFSTCLNGCPTTGTAATTCINGCKSSHASGFALFQTALQCTQSSCATPCGI